LKRRRQSIERIHVATESLEEKVASFEQMQAELDAQKKALQLLEQELKNAISTDLSSMRDAA
jgi:multidrug resistance efflux pump